MIVLTTKKSELLIKSGCISEYPRRYRIKQTLQKTD